ncbi:MAG: AAA family ATPase [Caulobacteraceae bacterium]
MRTIAIASRKGGSGKTTVASHLALAAHLRGRQCVIADADPQRSSTTIFKMRETEGPRCVETTGRKLFAQQLAALREGARDLIIDTPAAEEDELAYAIVIADLTVLVVRPTFLDFAAIARTADVIRRLGKRAVIVVNQAPFAREGLEAPAVRQVPAALEFVRLPIAPVVLRQRLAYQNSLATGQSVEETEPAGAAAGEIAALWRYVNEVAAG